MNVSLIWALMAGSTGITVLFTIIAFAVTSIKKHQKSSFVHPKAPLAMEQLYLKNFNTIFSKAEYRAIAKESEECRKDNIPFIGDDIYKTIINGSTTISEDFFNGFGGDNSNV